MAKVRGWRVPDFSLHHYLQLRKLKLDLFINNSFASGLSCPAARGIFMCMFPHRPAPRPPARSLPRRAGDASGGLGRTTCDRLRRAGRERLLLDHRRHLSLLGGVGRQVVESPAEVIFPPCGHAAARRLKQKSILHVGRFIADLGTLTTITRDRASF